MQKKKTEKMLTVVLGRTNIPSSKCQNEEKDYLFNSDKKI